MKRHSLASIPQMLQRFAEALTVLKLLFQGRKGVEWVIDQLKKEWRDISDKVSSEVHEMGEKLRHAWQDQTR